jgi:hypothetical protein
MKKKIYVPLILALLASNASFAQMKIKNTISGGNLPHASAILDLESDDKGLLMPRISLNSTTDWGLSSGTSTPGMVVYNKNAAITGTQEYPAVGEGLYMFDGTGWAAIEINKKNGYWKANGNAETDATHFIGTTDNKNLVFKVNNTTTAVLDTISNVRFGANALSNLSSTLVGDQGKYNVAIGDNAAESTHKGNHNVALGFSALKGANDDVSNNNIAIGMQALEKVNNSKYNIAIGGTAMSFNDQPVENSIAIGYGAMHSIGAMAGGPGFPDPQNNISIGYGSMYEFGRGEGNTVLGADAGKVYWDGSNNTFIGSNAASTHSFGENNTALGANSQIADGIDGSTVIGEGASVNISNAVVIGKSGNKVGIGIDSPEADLHVGGTGAIIIPRGTTAERPASAVEGMIRINTDGGTPSLEYYDGTDWVNL